MRGSMLEVIRQDYIRTARAKGLSERVVVYKHALRNSLIPIITLLAGLLPGLLGGSVVVERIFTIPGLGLLGFNAVIERDYPIVMAILTITAVLTMLGVLFADLMYSIVDPRIAFSKKSA
jgi:peptide/nickel transport system permease protein